MGGNAFVYIHHKEYAWHPATLTKTEGDKAHVKVPIYADEQAIVSDGGRAAKKHEEQVVKLKDYPANVLPLQNVDANGDLIEFPDMVELPYLHEVSNKENTIVKILLLGAFALGLATGRGKFSAS